MNYIMKVDMPHFMTQMSGIIDTKAGLELLNVCRALASICFQFKKPAEALINTVQFYGGLHLFSATSTWQNSRSTKFTLLKSSTQGFECQEDLLEEMTCFLITLDGWMEPDGLHGTARTR